MRRASRALVAAFSSALLFCAGASVALTEPTCRQALALGLDVSGSVDAGEYRLQLDGLAAALEQPDVVEAFLADPSHPIELAIYEWSGPTHQRILLDWIGITGPDQLERAMSTLRGTQRVKGDPSTGIGAAMLFGERLLAPRACWSRTLDISGDGASNTGPRPQDVRFLSGFNTITINGLVIGNGDGNTDLKSYYEELVIHGIGSFVEQADGFSDYENAMARKLLRELIGMVVSRAGPTDTRQ